jgi:hypothetical protein
MRNCLIFGSGRCGTSALAGALAKSGVFTGLHPVGATSQMPHGYFEDHHICHWNNELLKQSCDYSGILIAPIPLEARERMPLAKFPVPMNMRRYFWFQPYAFKDPRFAFTYLAWKPFFVQPHVNIVLFRNPSDFVDSALRLRADHPSISRERTALEGMWANAYQHVLANDDGTFFYVEHDELMNGNAMTFLETLLGYPIRQDFIEPKLSHVTDAKCPDALWPIYHELRDRAANRDKTLAATA